MSYNNYLKPKWIQIKKVIHSTCIWWWKLECRFLWRLPSDSTERFSQSRKRSLPQWWRRLRPFWLETVPKDCPSDPDPVWPDCRVIWPSISCFLCVAFQEMSTFAVCVFGFLGSKKGRFWNFVLSTRNTSSSSSRCHQTSGKMTWWSWYRAASVLLRFWLGVRHSITM